MLMKVAHTERGGAWMVSMLGIRWKYATHSYPNNMLFIRPP